MNDDMAKQLSELTGKPAPNQKKKASHTALKKNYSAEKNKKIDHLDSIYGVKFPSNSKIFNKLLALVLPKTLSTFAGSYRSANTINTILGIKNDLGLSKKEQISLEALKTKVVLTAFQNAKNEYRLGKTVNKEHLKILSDIADQPNSLAIQLWDKSPPEKSERMDNIAREDSIKKEIKKALSLAEAKQRELRIKKAAEEYHQNIYLEKLDDELSDKQLIKQTQYDRMKHDIVKALFPFKKIIFATSVSDLLPTDFTLAAIWYLKDDSIEDIKDLDDYFEKCPSKNISELSARNAEKIAIKFYETLGCKVIDVARHQLSMTSDEWKKFDLEVDQRFIDVKNARKPKNNPANYSEQYVKRFKNKDSQGISYLGILSDYQTKTSAQQGEYYEATVLGEFTESDIETMTNFVNNYFNSLFELGFSTADDKKLFKDTGKKGLFIPGWMFDYPEIFYTGQLGDTDIDLKIKELNEFNAQHSLSKKNIPLFSIASKSNDILNFIDEVKSKYEITRRIIFLMVLGFTLRKIHENDTFYRPSHWNQHIFHNNYWFQVSKGIYSKHQSYLISKSAKWPMKRFDSEEYISNLINMLDSLWEQDPNPLIKYDSFYMQNWNILKGKQSNGQQETIYAYCGGWNLEEKDGPCGTNPLIQGANDLCRCNLLICNNCHTCWEGCDENSRRRAEALRKLQPENDFINSLDDYEY